MSVCVEASEWGWVRVSVIDVEASCCLRQVSFVALFPPVLYLIKCCPTACDRRSNGTGVIILEN